MIAAAVSPVPRPVIAAAAIRLYNTITINESEERPMIAAVSPARDCGRGRGSGRDRGGGGAAVRSPPPPSAGY